MGGSVGLKGTDGLAEKALKLGAKEIAPARAKSALIHLFQVLKQEEGIRLRVLTPSHPMGEGVCREAMKKAGISEKKGPVRLEEIYTPSDPARTTSRDTVEFCNLVKNEGADLILFAGGDGTARDIVGTVGEDIPILGIPCGVKMHSGVFALTPEDAGEVVLQFLKGEATLEGREVMDLDENAYRSGEIRTRLFGLARVPVTTRVQGCKNILSSPDDREDRRSIGMAIREFMMEHPGLYLMGAGSTIRDIGRESGLELTPLGFDAVLCGANGTGAARCTLIGKDVNEEAILRIFRDFPEKKRYLILTPIGAQGFILGRGTQVISERVLLGLNRENIIVAATPGKLEITPVLRVDAGAFNKKLQGFIRVIVGYRRSVLRKVM